MSTTNLGNSSRELTDEWLKVWPSDATGVCFTKGHVEMFKRYFCHVACILTLGLPACGGTDGQPSTPAATTAPGSGGDGASGNRGTEECLSSAKFDYVMEPTYFDEDVPGGAILTQVDGDDSELFFVAEGLYSVPTSGGKPTLRYPVEIGSYWVRDHDVVVQDGKQLLSVSRNGNDVSELAPLSVSARAGVLVGDELVMQYFDHRRKEGSTGSESSAYAYMAQYFTKDIETGNERVLFEAETDDALSQRFAISNGVAYVAVGSQGAPRRLHALPLDGSNETEIKSDTAFTELEVLDATDDGLLLFGKPEGGSRSLYRLPLAGGAPQEIDGGQYVGTSKPWFIYVKRGVGGLALEKAGVLLWVADGSSEVTQVGCVDDGAFSAFGIVRIGDFFYTNVFDDHAGTEHYSENGLIRIPAPR